MNDNSNPSNFAFLVANWGENYLMNGNEDDPQVKLFEEFIERLVAKPGNKVLIHEFVKKYHDSDIEYEANNIEDE